MRPVRKLAIGLWVAVFVVAGIRFGMGRNPVAQDSTVNSTANLGVDSTVKLQPTDSKKASTQPLQAGDALPTIALKDTRGDSRSLAEWSGRTLLLNFWATWCAPCRKEMPLLQQFQESQDPARMQVLGIAIDRRDPVLQFVGEAGVTYPNLIGEMDATRLAERFAAGFALPLSVVAAPDGTVLAVHMGELTATDLEQVASVAAGLAAGKLSVAAAPARLRLGSGSASGL